MPVTANKLSFNCGFINLNHERAASNLIENDVFQKDFDLICLNEPYFYQGSICGCPKGYKQIDADVEPNVAFFIKNIFSFVKPEMERDIIALMRNWNNTVYLIINIYCRASGNIEDSMLKLEIICTRHIDKRIIIFGDFNAKSSAWSPRPRDERGRLDLEFANKLDLLIENNCD
ncbi:hypothetical protein AVEN_23423-1 [Araneus ventricosus]|uniref:Endonuclease/exonuclease/phosphatase domain-containing protein n=1 Tax=Araneus ventricosus TaxID=182803 RepID=A0A4Y2E6W2_ARAVE|nr:hypothetical protein AVEN_23423-1 [Araneus ventricosus]